MRTASPVPSPLGDPPTPGGTRDEALPQCLDFLAKPRHMLDVRFDPVSRTVWCAMRHENTVSWTLPLLQELNALNADIRALYEQNDFVEPPIKFFIGGSLRPDVFSMGGDLPFFVDRVRARDTEGLRSYAYACVEAIYENYHGFDSPVVTMALLEGDALGGGFEAALSCQFVIAERGVNLGFPEALFQTFPGMGAYSLVSRRLDPARAEKLILSGRMCKAEELHEMGLIDILAEKGEGQARAQRFIADNGKRHALLGAIGKVRRRIAPLTREELRDITDIWVESVMNLAPINLRKMEMLAMSQDRLFQQAASQRFRQS
ncbi:crotonase/enoyl-CoA hydratase family protein [uncultured Rhodoblastus sp.]|uniref:crotonase/enoyl-CoA hydratase family protein n=1 Tax=uncultured Rhodoblastus sp. TaxID=543037 RepID=UPI0025EE50E0|nr:crotonase/enoyl-CoA hydratase family protein [uncultured Rhodoblastus sp.]